MEISGTADSAAVNRRLYEGMFLVDSAKAADWDATKATVENVLKRADAEIVDMKKWDDRRLAYEIDGKVRGAYILCYFKADCHKVQDIEKAVQLSEQIMRVLILSTEQMTAADMQKDTPAARAENEAAAAEEARAARVAEAGEAAESAESGDVHRGEHEQKGSEVKAGDAAPDDGATEAEDEVREGDESDKPDEAEEVKGLQEAEDNASGEAESEEVKDAEPQ